MRVAALLFVVAVSLSLRILLCVARPLWHDERFTVWISRQPAAAIVEALSQDSGPPGFYLLEKAALSAAGRRVPLEIAARILPLLATFLLLLRTRALSARERAAWVVLTSTFALVNLYAAEARAYALLALLAFAVFRLAHAGPETGRRLALLAGAGAAALYTHYLAIFAVAAAAVVALAGGRRRSAAACVGAFALFSPWIPVLMRQPPSAIAWLRESPAAILAGLLSALGGVGRIPAPFGAPLPPLLTSASVVAGILLAAATATAARREPSARAAFLFVVLVLGGAAAASAFVRPLAFAGRWEMTVVPVWLWAVMRAAGVSRLARGTAWAAAALGVVATGLVAASPHPTDTATVAVRRLSTLSRPGDSLVAGPGIYLAARLASERGELPASVRSLPLSDASHPGWFNAATPGPAEEGEVARAMEELPPDARLFLLLPPAYDTPGIMRTLSSRGTARELVRQPDAVLLVWSPAPAVAAP